MGKRFSQDKILIGAALGLAVVVIVLTAIFVTRRSPENSLQKTEKVLPTGKPQVFWNENEKGTGALVVTANIKGVIVTIDSANEEAPINTKRTGKGPLPFNTPPFTLSKVPAGEHKIVAAKLGYIPIEKPFLIKADGITRLHLDLKPIGSSEPSR